MIFYSDTNGKLPHKRSTALFMLGVIMDSTPLDEIDFTQFKKVAPELDSVDELDLFGLMELPPSFKKQA